MAKSLARLIPPSPARSMNMAAVKRVNTEPEVALRSALHRVGLRFRKDFPIRVAGSLIRPDIVFTRLRIAVFIDGCFWHTCPIHGSMPATNTEFWKQKLEGNAARDALQSERLADAGWLVVRVWEHEPLNIAVAMVRMAVESRRNPDI